MQDRYAGDLGDFLKFGLLRNLVTGDGAAPPLTLGRGLVPDRRREPQR
jgi:hypothetical protein